MRFEVPQFIEIEDKIFGPFTWRQFLYLTGGVGLAVVMFITMPIFIFALIGLPIGALALALAFYPVNNRPFSVFLESMLRYYNGTRVYHWGQTSTTVYRDRGDTRYESNVIHTIEPTTVTGDNISSLSRQLELHALQKPEA